MDDVILEARGLDYRYPGSGEPALRGLSLSARHGRRLAILGANGAGKTTLLLHLNGTLRPRAGVVLVDGVPGDTGRAGLTAWRRRVGLVLQEADDQLFAATVAEDISFGPLNLGLGAAEVARRVADVVARMGLTGLEDRPPHMLSHGQRKRVAIAGILAMQPAVLVLDEPTAGFDHAGQTALLSTLEHLSASGMTLVFSTHDVDLAYAFADDAALFAGGTVLAQGDARAVLSDAALMARAGLPLPAVPALAARLHALGVPFHREARTVLELIPAAGG
ncbi:cobalt/nickel transport system ATP-binding protein [Azospirillum fermentarium]|uniref:energy-coupling factor ABC transporter ATP-binding protein n=1 Tax=Azospirillum fermentarium TaxID=1233114 RepID=UPI0022271F87|nr:ATP-binding cassette domain-containing protein [Azospirillum fermentarium]MCW2249095.1 cobalt/nickel transport system ATP-binding protein [Azospirillum fermentarium]